MKAIDHINGDPNDNHLKNLSVRELVGSDRLPTGLDYSLLIAGLAFLAAHYEKSRDDALREWETEWISEDLAPDARAARH